MTIRLKGPALAALRREVMTRDQMRCVECRRRIYDDVPDWAPNKAHMAHRKGRGAGGEDTPENTEARCGECHFRWEHAPRAVRKKR